jgi:HSF-type DNA-binding
MMAMMRFVDQFKDDENYCAAWLPDGKSFVVRNPDDFTRQVVPQFFKATKFSSFTRKLYRWGFRQINRGIGPDDPVIFGNEFFDRDNEALMSRMRSVTAAGTRKTDTRPYLNSFGKRPLDGGANNMYDMNDPQKRFLYEQFLQQQQQQQKSMQLMNQNPSLYTAMSTNSGPMASYPTPHMIVNNKPYESLMQSPSGSSQQHHMHMPYNHMPPQQQQQHSHPAMPPQTPQDMGMSHHMAGGPPSGGGMGLHNVSSHSQTGSYHGGGGGGGNNQNTAEIVNAAIRALQYSS